MNMVYNKLIFLYIKVKPVNKDEQNATFMLNTSRHHMIKCSCELL